MQSTSTTTDKCKTSTEHNSIGAAAASTPCPCQGHWLNGKRFMNSYCIQYKFLTEVEIHNGSEHFKWHLSSSSFQEVMKFPG